MIIKFLKERPPYPIGAVVEIPDGVADVYIRRFIAKRMPARTPLTPLPSMRPPPPESPAVAVPKPVV